MKRSFITLFLFVPILVASAQELKPVTVAQFVHPPLAYLEPGTNVPKGAEIAFYTEVLKGLGYNPNFVFVPFPRVIELIKSGEAALGPFLTRTKERDEFSHFTEIPPLNLVPVLIVRNDNPLKELKSPKDVAALKIGFSAGLTLPPFFTNAESLSIDRATGENLTEQNLRKLVGKRFDAAIDLNPLNVRLAAKTLGITADIRLINIPGDEIPYYVIASKKSPIGKALIDGINTALSRNKNLLDPYIQAELR